MDKKHGLGSCTHWTVIWTHLYCLPPSLGNGSLIYNMRIHDGTSLLELVGGLSEIRNMRCLGQCMVHHNCQYILLIINIRPLICPLVMFSCLNAFVPRLNRCSQILVWMPLDNSPLLHNDPGLGRATCFGQWDMSRCDVSRGWKSMCALGLVFSEPRCHARKSRPGWCSWTEILRPHGERAPAIPGLPWRESPYHPRALVEPNPEPIFQPKSTTRATPAINGRTAHKTQRILRNSELVLF